MFEQLMQPLAPTRLARRRTQARTPIGFSAAGGAGAPAAAPLALPDDTHLMTVAPTGAGKGVNCVIPTLLQYPGPVIVFDPKGEHAAVTARRRREMGQEVLVVDPFGVSGLPAARFNPLDFVEPDTAEAADDARFIAEMLMPTRFGSRDVFWRNRAMHFLTVAILHAVTDFYPDHRSMVTVRDAVHQMSRRASKNQSDPGNAKLMAQLALKSRNPEVARLNELFDLGSIETVGGMLHTALEGVGFVRGPLVEQSLARSDFTLDDVTEGAPLTLYLVLPPHLIPSHGTILRLWLGTLFGAIMRRSGRPDHATLLLLDEAAQLGQFPPLRTAVTLLRGYGLQTWSFWQDPSQLMQVYPQDWRSLVNNCGIVQVFGPRSAAAAETLGLSIEQESRGVDCDGPDGMLIFEQGTGRFADRIDYRTDPALAGLYDANPLHRRQGGAIRRSRSRMPTPDAEPTKPPQDDGFRQVYDAIRSCM